MASPISPMEAIEIVQKAIELCKKINDMPELFKTVEKRMEDLEFYLSELKVLLDDAKQHNKASLRPTQEKRLRNIITDIETYSGKVVEILEKWHQKVGPFGFTFRFAKVAQAWSAINSTPEKLEKLSNAIEEQKQKLRDILQLWDLFIGIGQPNPPAPKIHTTTMTPAPPKAEYTVLFVDPSNVGRSKVGEGYMKLLQQWTVKTGGRWSVKYAHSAGTRVRNRSNLVDQLQAQSPSFAVVDGNQTPSEVAMASLFDNKFFNYPWKANIQDYLMKSRSRGITSSIFSLYDFVLVFTGRELESLQRLQQADSILKAGQVSKTRILHLGSYLNKGSKSKDIVDPSREADGSFSRAKWNSTTSQIKLATRTFLQDELEWKQPPKGASQT